MKATDHGGARETLIDGETGWLTPPGDARALAAAVNEAIEIDPPARQALAARAMARVRANFSKLSMCAATLEIYGELLAAGPDAIQAA